ncbi:saccharopine dehydrogenase NADP-binding domain-containing protein [Variovorax sp. J22G21]|nr:MULTISPECIES: saccharopine dehydrogenase NADP-binding domain-containing protein [unclassified Variovorax]MDM0042761.1 saccharopine dehydrogenase NADP-binding domain-containing protein [Variovorax sp. J22R193]MDM0064844.1 saccharopine dehydrogenase NADP-binding domain-containing protein [Variovorax sp. J22G21]
MAKGASGYTGRLVAEHFARRYGVGGKVKWVMAGRSQAKLAKVRDQFGAPKDTLLEEVDANDTALLSAMIERTKAIVTTVCPHLSTSTGETLTSTNFPAMHPKRCAVLYPACQASLAWRALDTGRIGSGLEGRTKSS